MHFSIIQDSELKQLVDISVRLKMAVFQLSVSISVFAVNSVFTYITACELLAYKEFSED